MANNNEHAMLLLPSLRRADELQNHEPLLRLLLLVVCDGAGLKIIPQSQCTKATDSLLFSLMKPLEKDKKSLNRA